MTAPQILSVSILLLNSLLGFTQYKTSTPMGGGGGGGGGNGYGNSAFGIKSIPSTGICAGMTVDLYATGGNHYNNVISQGNWTTDDTTAIITCYSVCWRATVKFKKAGTYILKFSSSVGNESLIINVSEKSYTSINLPFDSVCDSDLEFKLNDFPYTGTFSGAGVSEDIFDPKFASPGMNKIIHQYVDPQGCIVTDENSIYVSECNNETSTGSKILNALSELHVYPNPSTGIFNINNSINGLLDIEVYNSLGSLIHKTRQTNKLDLSGNPSGFYFLMINDNGINKKIKVFLN